MFRLLLPALSVPRNPSRSGMPGPSTHRTVGFRLSIVDAVVLVAAGPATWLAWPHLGSLAGVIPLVVLHFFLFCNVFRIHRTKELV